MSRQLLTAAAAAILWAHVAVIAFNVFGLIVIPLGTSRGWRFVRVIWWRALHLGALAPSPFKPCSGKRAFLRFGKAIFSCAQVRERPMSH